MALRLPLPAGPDGMLVAASAAALSALAACEVAPPGFRRRRLLRGAAFTPPILSAQVQDDFFLVPEYLASWS
jgi:hypothetical protein